LGRLAAECRALIGLNSDVKLALALRLAVAHKIVTAQGASWSAWCFKHITKRDNKPYSIHAINKWVRLGQARNPAKAIAKFRKIEAKRHAESQREATAAIKVVKLITTPAGPRRVIPNISAGYDALLRAWEAAGPEARKQFLYFIGANLGALSS